MSELATAAVPARTVPRAAPTDDAAIRVLALAVRDVCGRLTAAQLEQLRRSAQGACLMPRHVGWDRRAAAHAEIFALLADAADHQVLARMLDVGVGFTHHLMIAAGPVAGLVAAHSSERLVALLSVGDAEAAADEMEGHLKVLRFLGRLARCSAAGNSAAGNSAAGEER
jgi:DNA-binding GntR family transcriptional regulator